MVYNWMIHLVKTKKKSKGNWWQFWVEHTPCVYNYDYWILSGCKWQGFSHVRIIHSLSNIDASKLQQVELGFLSLPILLFYTKSLIKEANLHLNESEIGETGIGNAIKASIRLTTCNCISRIDPCRDIDVPCQKRRRMLTACWKRGGKLLTTVLAK